MSDLTSELAKVLREAWPGGHPDMSLSQADARAPVVADMLADAFRRGYFAGRLDERAAGTHECHRDNAIQRIAAERRDLMRRLGEEA